MRGLKQKIGIYQPKGKTFVIDAWAEWCYMNVIKHVKRTFVFSRFLLDPCGNAQCNLPISLKPDGIVSFLLGKFPARIGERPHKVFVPSIEANVLSSLLQKYCHLDFNTCLSAVCTGSFLTNLPYFKKMFTNIPVTSPPSEEDWNRIYEIFHKKVPLPALPRPLFRNVFGLEIKPDTFPGARERYFCKFLKKATALPTDITVLRDVWFRVARGDFFPECIWSIGAREKREELATVGEVKTRGVLMPEGWYALFESLYSRGIETSIHGIKTSSFYLGHSMCHWGWVRYFRDVCRQGMAFEGDFKGFDTTVREELLVRSFCLLRSCYPDSVVVDRHFTFIMKNFIYKNVLSPGGWIYRCNKGLPSGTSFTSLLGTCVNILVLIDIFLNYPEFKVLNLKIELAKFCVCGDDFVVSFPKGSVVSEKVFHLIGKKLCEEEFDAWLAARHGMKIKKPSLKYGDAASSKTLFGQVWREFHCSKGIKFPVPVFFFEGQKSFVNEIDTSQPQVSVPTFDVPPVSIDFSREQRRQVILDLIPEETLETITSEDRPNFVEFNDLLSLHIQSEPEDSKLKQMGKVFNFLGMTSNYWLFLRSYFIASNKSASFLKTIIWKGRPNIGFDDLYWRILLPSSKNRVSWDPLNFLRSVFVAFPLIDYHNAWIITYFILVRNKFKLTCSEVKSKFARELLVNDFHYYNIYFGTGGELLSKSFSGDGKSPVSKLIQYSSRVRLRDVINKFSLCKTCRTDFKGVNSFRMFPLKQLHDNYGAIVPNYT